MRILLASKSPRRKLLLEALGHEVTSIAPNILEKEHQKGQAVSELVMLNAQKKMLALSSDFPSKLILGADTLVYLPERDEVFGQPKSAEDAEGMLERLSGKTHQVLTGFAIWTGQKLISDFALSLVTMRKLKRSEISAYVRGGESLDKAGSYGVQGAGAALIDRIDGSLTNVIGLPIKEIFLCLEPNIE